MSAVTGSASTPGLSQFNPRIIKHQYEVIRDVRKVFSYKDGLKHEILLSGAVGSAKSITVAHLAVTHCLLFKGARFFLGRKALPDLKRTIYTKILEHLADQHRALYYANDSTAYIKFANGSEIISGSWSDKRYKKFRSLELSAAAIEELTENDEKDAEAYHEIKMRIGRLPHVPESFLISATNPDSPAHWAHKHFIEQQSSTRHVYYSVTADNPFLPPEYVKQLEKDLDPKLAQRMLHGRWIDLAAEGIYYEYSQERNFRSKQSYTVNPKLPVHWSWDFNIGKGKPMSCVFFQMVGDEAHVFAEIVVEGARTLNICEEALARGLIMPGVVYRINGDATGGARTTTSILSNYDQIEEFLKNTRLKNGQTPRYLMEVPRENPPIKERHNIVNSYCQNLQKRARLFIYQDCPTTDQGMRLTKLRQGAGYVEDDSKWFQHVTTALGYGLVYHYYNANQGNDVRMYPR